MKQSRVNKTKSLNKLFIIVGLFSSLSMSTAYGEGFLAGMYTLTEGDANADTYTDYFLEAVPNNAILPGPYEVDFDVDIYPPVRSSALLDDGSQTNTYNLSGEYPYGGGGSWGTSGHVLHFHDFNADGNGDIFLHADQTGEPSFMLFGSDGVTAPTLSQTIVGTELGSDIAGQAISFSDIDGDGLLDLVLASTQVAYLKAGSFGTLFANPPPTDTDGLADSDGDGLADRYDIAPHDNTIAVSDSDGDGIADLDDLDSNTATVSGLDSNDTNLVGSLPGTFEVDNMGKAVYHLPFDALPSAGNAMPPIGLTYKQASGNGLAGVGWNVSGLSEITRCPRTIEQDSKADGITYYDGDKYCLNGQRLNVFSGGYGNDGSEYATEIDGMFFAIAGGTIKNCDNTNAPEMFEVQYPDGTREVYGLDEQSRLRTNTCTGADGSPVLTWALKERIPPEGSDGNDVIYSYFNDYASGSFYITSIKQGNYEYSFNYENRPDQTVKYDRKTKTTQDKRLKSVALKYNNITQKTYHLSYILGDYNRSLLQSVKLCYRDVQTNCLPPTEFAWNPGDTEYQLTNVTENNASLIIGKHRIKEALGDVNGDGFNDLVWTYVNLDGIYAEVFYGQADGQLVWDSASQALWDVPECVVCEGGASNLKRYSMQVGDINGDGYADAVWGAHWGHKYIIVNFLYDPILDKLVDHDYLHIDVSPDIDIRGDKVAVELLVADINADGFEDIIFAHATGLHVDELGLNDDRVGYDAYLMDETATFSAAPSCTQDFEQSLFTASGQGPELHYFNQFFSGDVNGDGKADLIYVFPSASYVYIDAGYPASGTIHHREDLVPQVLPILSEADESSCSSL